MATPVNMRDSIAIEAMKIILRGSIEFDDLQLDEDEIANKAYHMADAMMNRRRGGGT